MLPVSRLIRPSDRWEGARRRWRSFVIFHARGGSIARGTDGYGRSVRTRQLRKHFEVVRNHIAIAALRALADEGKVDKAFLAKADEERRTIGPDEADPWKILIRCLSA